MSNKINKVSHIPTIVVVGGGAGGLELATVLGKKLGKRKLANIVLVDHSATHIWKPLLHEVAAGTVNSAMMELNYFIHGANAGYEFQLGRMQGLNRHEKTIAIAPLHDAQGHEILPARDIEYSLLVMAVGSTCNDFNTPGAKEFCTYLDSRAKAESFHQQFLNRFVVAHSHLLPAEENFLDIAIIGGGATGVELAAELQTAAEAYSALGLDEIQSHRIAIHIIEASPRLLGALPEEISASAKIQLEKLGIKVHLNTRVDKVTEEGIHTHDGALIAASLKVWCAGVKAPTFLAALDGLEVNKNNQLILKPSLQTTQDDSIFALGDCSFSQQNGVTSPPTAQCAHQQASFLEHNIYRYLQQEPLQDFIYQSKGSLVSISKTDTLGVLMGNINIHGFMAKILYKFLYQLHLIRIHGPLKTLAILSSNLFRRATSPRIKLH